MEKTVLKSRPNHWLKEIPWIGSIFALAVAVLFPSTPLLYLLPDTDSSIFLYIGEKIRAGQFPYLNWYDHKPPLIFYINALGLALGNGSRWGVWALELVSLSAFGVLGFLFLRRYFGRFTAAMAVGLALFHFAFVYERGNLTEEYALPSQFAAIFLLGEIERTGKTSWRLFGIGCMLAMASSLKQPLAGVGLSIVVYLAVVTLLRGDWLGLLWAGVQIGLGFAAVWAAWFIYFALSGVFPEFWEAAFQYNFALSGIPLDKRILALLASLDKWGGNSGFFLGGMAVWLALIPFLIFKDSRPLRFLSGRWFGGGLVGMGALALIKGLLSFRATAVGSALIFCALGLALIAAGVLVLSGRVERRLSSTLTASQPSAETGLFLPLMIALVDFPVAFFLSSLSGNNYSHYFMALLPSLAILTAFAIYLLRSSQSTVTSRAMTGVWAVVLIAAVALPGIQRTAEEYKPKDDRQVEDLIAYVRQNTAPRDYVLQWGVAPGINLITGRDSPTRFFFADPLFVIGYSGKMQSAILLSELQAKPPLLIIDSKIPRLALITVKDPAKCDQVKDPNYYDTVLKRSPANQNEISAMPEGMGDVYYWICQNYTRTAVVGELKWDVYRLKGK